MINNFKRQGFIVSPDMEKAPLIDEMIKFWPVKKIDVIQTGIVVQSTADFFISFETWFKETLNRVAHGWLPIYRLGGRWMSTSKEIYTNYVGDVRSRAILFFGAILAYAALAELHPEYKTHLFEITVHTDLSISIPVGSYAHVEYYRQFLSQMMLESSRWSLWYPKTALEAVLMRYYVQENVKDLRSLDGTPLCPAGGCQTLAFYEDNKFYCLVRTYHQLLSFPRDQLSILADDLKSKLICHSQREMSKDQSLTELLQTISNPCQPQPYPTPKWIRTIKLLVCLASLILVHSGGILSNLKPHIPTQTPRFTINTEYFPLPE